VHPVLFKVFGFEVRSWSVLLLLGALAGAMLAARRARRFGFQPGAIGDLAWVLLLAGVLGARLGWVVQELPYYVQHPAEILNFRAGGMTSYGGVFGALLALAIWCKRTGASFLTAFDWLAAPGLVANALGRVGCFLNGCCYGGPCDLPWAVPIHPEGGGPVYQGHPAQLYDTALSLLAAGLLLAYERRFSSAPPKGRLTAFFFLAYGASRFVLEIFRTGASSGSSFGWSVSDGMILAIALFGVGVLLLVALRRSATTASSEDGSPGSAALAQPRPDSQRRSR
jgi:phosphatidylglycerol:prolipoprotein diacylglycerol transferase